MLTTSYQKQLLDYVAHTPAYKAQAESMKMRSPTVQNVSELKDIASLTVTNGNPDPGGDTQAGIDFRLDVTGHVMVAATKDQNGKENQAVQDLFSECSVLLGAVTAALNAKGKTLYDYNELRQVLMGCGDFVSLQISDKTFHSSDSSVMLDVAVIAEVMGAFVGIEALEAAPSVMNIAKNVVSNVGNKITLSKSDQSSSKNIGHLMFICQNLMGAPMVSLSYFYSSYSESMSQITTPCVSTSSTKVDFAFHQEDFMFVSPAAIAKYSPELTADRSAYDKLIASLTALIK